MAAQLCGARARHELRIQRIHRWRVSWLVLQQQPDALGMPSMRCQRERSAPGRRVAGANLRQLVASGNWTGWAAPNAVATAGASARAMLHGATCQQVML
eukprot:365363-Chlamydomonas_euryale.AAC.8